MQCETCKEVSEGGSLTKGPPSLKRRLIQAKHGKAEPVFTSLLLLQRSANASGDKDTSQQ